MPQLQAAASDTKTAGYAIFEELTVQRFFFR